MHIKTFAGGMIAASVATLGMVASAAPASAHVGREVGDHEFVVGFGEEPAYTGQPNSVQLLISHHDGESVNEIDGRLDVEVGYGDETTDLGQPEPFFVPGESGEEGDYRAWFVPTRPGAYTFRITGEMEGKKVDESFTSGPKTFSEVESPTTAGFPVRDPTTGEIAERLDREVPRLNDEIAAAADSAKNSANTALIVAVIAVLLGAAGLLFAIVAMSRGRSRV